MGFLVGAAKPGALAIPRCFLDPNHVGMAGERTRLTRRIDLPVSGPGVRVGRSLGWLGAGASEVPEAAQVVTILLSSGWGMFHPWSVTLASRF